MPRFFVDTAPAGDRVTLTGEDARHIARSLRMQPGEALTVCDGGGRDFDCEIETVEAEAVCVRVVGSHASRGEPSVDAALYMALPKADKMELIVQKAVELGVREIVPVFTARCVSRPDRRALAKKIERWSKIAAEAAKQCGRGRIPRVRDAMTFEEAVSEAAKADAPLFLYEGERENGLRQALRRAPFATAALLVGPEGGFAAEEAEAAGAAGLWSVSLGPRILRCETAPLAALAAVMYESGNF